MINLRELQRQNKNIAVKQSIEELKADIAKICSDTLKEMEKYKHGKKTNGKRQWAG